MIPSSSSYCSKPGCSNEAPLRCSGCKKAHYCSKECQKEAWKAHKIACAHVNNQYRPVGTTRVLSGSGTHTNFSAPASATSLYDAPSNEHSVPLKKFDEESKKKLLKYLDQQDVNAFTLLQKTLDLGDSIEGEGYRFLEQKVWEGYSFCCLDYIIHGSYLLAKTQKEGASQIAVALVTMLCTFDVLASMDRESVIDRSIEGTVGQLIYCAKNFINKGDVHRLCSSSKVKIAATNTFFDRHAAQIEQYIPTSPAPKWLESSGLNSFTTLFGLKSKQPFAYEGEERINRRRAAFEKAKETLLSNKEWVLNEMSSS